MAATATGMAPTDALKAAKRATSSAPGAAVIGWGRDAGSGNVAFDEYREETLRKLDEEQREFRDFLDRLRAAKDRAEFDEFMNERRNRPPTTEPPPAALRSLTPPASPHPPVHLMGGVCVARQ